MCFKQHASFNREKRQSSFLLCEVLRNSWGFHEMNNNKKKNKNKQKKLTDHVYFRGQITPHTGSKVHDSPSPFCKINGASHVSLVLNTWHVDEGRPSYSQRTSKSGESHAINDQVKMLDKKRRDHPSGSSNTLSREGAISLPYYSANEIMPNVTNRKL